jgi:glyoxylase-like metal-dependent hydrolase (beta-lactamase superfamily II)
VWTRDTAPPRPGVPSTATERATLVLAPNANAWTFEGTNTWVLAEPGSDVCAVLDPGPDDDDHLAAILATAGDRRIVAVFVTHAHHDHAELARRLSAVTGAPMRAAHPRLTDQPLQDDDEIAVGALTVRALCTPGHTGDSVCFLLPAEGNV